VDVGVEPTGSVAHNPRTTPRTQGGAST